jgi:hypothetical protein
MKNQTTQNLPIINSYTYKTNQSINILKDVKQIILTSSNFNTFLRSNKKHDTKQTNKSININAGPFGQFQSDKCRSTRELKTITFEDFFPTNVNTTSFTPISPKSYKTSLDLTTTYQGDTFMAFFSEYIGLGSGRLSSSGTLPNNIDVEKYCQDSVEKIKIEYENISYLIRVFNKNSDNEVKLKFKSFKFTINKSPRGKAKLYLPYDFIILFSFCNYEEIIFVLSQCIDIDEENYQISLNERNFYYVINRLPMFERKSFKNVFKFNHNISFRWLGKTKTFDVNLYCPLVSIFFASKNIVIKKHLNQSVLVSIFQKSFLDWDCSLLNLLSEEKEFRAHFNKIISRDKPYLFSKYRLVFRLDHRFDFIPLTFGLDHVTLPLVYLDENGKANFVLAYGYSIDLKKVTRNTKYLSWKNTQVLLRLKDTINLESSVNRRCKVDSENRILFDTDWLNSITEDLYSYFTKADETMVTCSTKQNFKLNEPRIDFQTLIGGRYRKRRMYITGAYLNDLAAVRSAKDIVSFVEKNIGGFQKELNEEESNLT